MEILSVLERFTLLDILPKQGSYVTLKILRKLREDLSFTEEEIKRYEIEERDGQVSWNPSAASAAGIEIGEKASDIIRDALKAMDRAGTLTDREFPLYERWVEGAA